MTKDELLRDLQDLETKIVAEDDKTLFNEAIGSIQGGSVRAAYILIWLACAESIKRRFRELATRDGDARRITSEFADKESKRQSIDKYLLDNSKSYGLIKDIEHIQLENIYSLRCVFGHPYEQMPRYSQIIEAATTAVETLLSQPTKLRHGYLVPVPKRLFFGNWLRKNIVQYPTFEHINGAFGGFNDQHRY